MQNKDKISRDLLSFLKESIRLKKIYIDGTDIYANYEDWEKFQREEYWKNFLVRLDI